ncbi:LytR family transcriptional attenuator [Jatrophihabitans sp. GAS493]|uniref:LCP family protein n=1 Tax=Jatrophihabitans sp. GAS493 TaxID=1907575 RepID=UPI000BB8A665|nr:LCP family protein [Jatrophihabitans sp. GAS493]SOD72998.1 LytR family transcriptional attenuator [Jatrophihabitans sp. GAS493]
MSDRNHDLPQAGVEAPLDTPDQLGPRPAGVGSHSTLGAGIRAVVALISLVTLVASGIAWASYQKFNSDIGHGAAVPALTGADADGADQNILLIGDDSRAGANAAELKALGTTDDGGSVNTDTMMILHVPAKGGKATVVSIPRDSWVDIPGFGKGKINSAYGDGYSTAKGKGADETASESAGIILLIKTLNGLTGLHIDHYMQVNLLGFYRISIAIGGVDVCLRAAQNPSTDSDANGHGYSGINLPAGHSVIMGTQALAFVRQRHGLPQGDLDRIKRQQYFLSAAFRKVATAGVLLNPFKLRDLLKAVSTSLLIDPALNVVSLAGEFQNMSAGNITFATIPNDGSQTIYPDGVETSIVAINTAALPSFIRTLQGKAADSALSAAPAAAPGSVSVDVLNGTSIAGLAAENGTALKRLGFHVETIDSTDLTPQTSVEYPEGLQGKAKAVANATPGAKLVLTDSVKKVTLVLGENGVVAKGVAAAPSTAPSTPPSAATSMHASVSSTTAAKKATTSAAVSCIN